MKIFTVDRSKIWTAEEYTQLKEINTPCELINGELFMSPSPSPFHQDVLSNLNDFFKSVALKIGGKVYFSPIDLYVDAKNVFQPDLLFLSKEKISFVTSRGIVGPPDLIVEVISSSNIFADRNTKKKTYLNFGIKEYWIVDPANRTLEIYTPENSQDTPVFFLTDEGEVKSSVIPELQFDLKDIFNP
jgi:Uma2 family endonuclease